MKSLILILLFTLAGFFCHSQTILQFPAKSHGTSCLTDPGMPSFPEGDSAMNLFIQQHFRDSLIRPGTNGRIFMQITVDTTGRLVQLNVLHGINAELDSEMVRFFSIMPKWIPAEKEGKKVAATFVIPVKVEDNKEREHGIN